MNRIIIEGERTYRSRERMSGTYVVDLLDSFGFGFEAFDEEFDVGGLEGREREVRGRGKKRTR